MDSGFNALNGEVFVCPVKQSLRASIEVQLAPGHRNDVVDFFLHRGLSVQRLSGDCVQSWHYNPELCYPFAPEGRGVRVFLDETEEAPSFSVRYCGNIDIIPRWEVNRISPEWVELGLYSPWFPLIVGEKSTGEFTYEMQVSVSGDYQLVGTGEVSTAERGWLVSSRSPSGDITFVAAPSFEHYRCVDDGIGLEVYAVADCGLPSSEIIADEGLKMLEHYQKWLGGDEERKVTVVVVPRSVGGGYVRDRFMVLSQDLLVDFADDEKRVLMWKWLAHEFAHLWWSNAPAESWEDWLNESFAEYSALRAVARHHGEEVAEEFLAKKRSKIEGLGPIVGIDRSDDEAHDVLYNKGCVLLWELHQDIGRDRFGNLLRRLVSKKVDRTEKFLCEIASVAGQAAARNFEQKLEE